MTLAILLLAVTVACGGVMLDKRLEEMCHTLFYIFTELTKIHVDLSAPDDLDEEQED